MINQRCAVIRERLILEQRTANRLLAWQTRGLARTIVSVSRLTEEGRVQMNEYVDSMVLDDDEAADVKASAEAPAEAPVGSAERLARLFSGNHVNS